LLFKNHSEDDCDAVLKSTETESQNIEATEYIENEDEKSEVSIEKKSSTSNIIDKKASNGDVADQAKRREKDCSSFENECRII